MSLFSTKAVVTFFVGSGGIAGSSYGVVRYVNSGAPVQRSESTGSEVSTRLESQPLALPEKDGNGEANKPDTANSEGQLSPKRSEEIESSNPFSEQEVQRTVGVGESQGDASQQLEDEEDGNEEDYKVEGTLAVVKGDVGDSYELKIYYKGHEAEEDKVLIPGIFFKAIQSTANSRVNSFNLDLWEVGTDWSKFLGTLESRRTELKKAFDDAVLDQLIQKVKEKAGVN
ncbi:hypothetical protein MHLP_02140 [Candidatus Mycoplasma haematolamae str. Purdue]|uniref:Uncharacterized protein n=1 Tax=Mycoplasma haematolamae (strain Purdue) TaxID=1212765 RepID=I7BJH6_MYCHA|nr:hypothetical protein [Candidatus Mycoplasma haematolamae]AFO52008.1 hypothetical protein MHLP_02140 [Candidatus Mycoplasma haematolamae str. Purdue]